jgi:hypothetical protein
MSMSFTLKVKKFPFHIQIEVFATAQDSGWLLLRDDCCTH